VLSLGLSWTMTSAPLVGGAPQTTKLPIWMMRFTSRTTPCG
jgi:hypothetical protein